MCYVIPNKAQDMSTWIYNDGGRVDAGYKPAKARDCAVRAIAIATQKPYDEIWHDLYVVMKDVPLMSKQQARIASEKKYEPDSGVFHQHLAHYLKSKSWKWVPTMSIGSGCKTHLKASELPAGRIICRVTRHFVAVVDGIIQDTHDCSRGGTRCVYGYYINEQASS